MKKTIEVIQYSEVLKRLCLLLKEIKNIAEELGTNDMTLCAHLLILDTIRIKNAAHFTGVEIMRAGRGKKLYRKSKKV